MRREGGRRHHVKKWGQLVDLELYGILPEEWKAIANKAMQRTCKKSGPDGKSKVASR